MCSVMLQNAESKSLDKDDIQKSPIAFLTKFFKWKKLCIRSNDQNSVPMCNKSDKDGSKYLSCSVTCIPSTVSVKDVFLTPCPPSPALSIPSRNKNIDHDMLALRLSRQDDPFLKVLASRESLADSFIADSENDGANAVPSALSPDVDPLTIPEFHKHMVRSPPPVNWPRSPVFRFEDSSQECLGFKSYRKSHHYSRESMDMSSGVTSPTLNISERAHRSSSVETKERRSMSSFSLIPPSSFRSLSEVRRTHAKGPDEN